MHIWPIFINFGVFWENMQKIRFYRCEYHKFRFFWPRCLDFGSWKFRGFDLVWLLCRRSELLVVVVVVHLRKRKKKCKGERGRDWSSRLHLLRFIGALSSLPELELGVVWVVEIWLWASSSMACWFQAGIWMFSPEMGLWWILGRFWVEIWWCWEAVELFDRKRGGISPKICRKWQSESSQKGSWIWFGEKMGGKKWGF